MMLYICTDIDTMFPLCFSVRRKPLDTRAGDVPRRIDGGTAMTLTHAWPTRAAAGSADALDWRAGLLAPVVRAVVEAALEAELDVHLADRSLPRPPGIARRNARNGTRSKTVRTAFGTVTIDAPRDRWGTFDPVAVGKWQRHVVGVDQLTVPLAAYGADPRESMALLGRVYRDEASADVPAKVVDRVRARMRPWHQRSLPAATRALLVDRAVVRSRDGRLASTPVRTVVAVQRSGARELVALRAAPQLDCLDTWHECLRDLADRGLADVDVVVAAPVPGLDLVVRRLWPSAARVDRHAPGAIWQEAVPA
jgi:putative transposase